MRQNSLKEGCRTAFCLFSLASKIFYRDMGPLGCFRNKWRRFLHRKGPWSSCFWMPHASLGSNKIHKGKPFGMSSSVTPDSPCHRKVVCCTGADGKMMADGSVMMRRTKRSLCKRGLLQKTNLSPIPILSLVSFPHHTISKLHTFQNFKRCGGKKVVLNIHSPLEILFCFCVQYCSNTHKSWHKKERNNEVVP